MVGGGGVGDSHLFLVMLFVGVGLNSLGEILIVHAGMLGLW